MNKTSTLEIMKLPIDSFELLRYVQENENEEPGTHVVDALLRYSRSLEIRPSEYVGQLEMVQN